MEGIFTIDCNYIQPNIACAYLIVENGRAIFVENNTSHALPYLLQALEDNKIFLVKMLIMQSSPMCIWIMQEDPGA
jgi:hypothetical protein